MYGELSQVNGLPELRNEVLLEDQKEEDLLHPGVTTSMKQ